LAGISFDRARRLAALLCLLFVLEGSIFIPYIGLQNDEAIFSGAIYPPPGFLHAVRIFGLRLPTMLMSYLGTFKAWLYKPIFAVVGPSIWSMRIPALLLGAATVWLLFVLIRRIAGARAALAATALLATDAAFVMTTCMDWGPVALQHLLLLTGMLLLWRFHEAGRWPFLAAGFFIFGLAMWDKALFSWALAGLVAGALAVFPRQLRSHLTWRNTGIAVVWLLVGATPLVQFNIQRRLATFRENTHFSAEDFSQKATLLRLSLEGGCLFGYMVRDEPPPEPVEPANPMESFSVWLSHVCRQRRAGFLPYACLLAAALLPWLWRTPARKPMLFAAVFVAVVWLQMAFTKGAGTGAHHVVLLWPFPHLFAGVGLAEASRKLGRAGLGALIAVLVTVCGSNAVVLNQYLAKLVENGPTVVWTDAINPLSEYLRTVPAHHMYVWDWGIMNSLRILNGGKLPLELPHEEVAGDDDSRAAAAALLTAPDAIVVAHSEGNEIFEGVNERVRALARSAGYRPEVLKVIADRGNRPIFQVFRFVEAAR
jgi:4-amino-4-deoxy-L-arabinose transferase-like glycosyltransferase